MNNTCSSVSFPLVIRTRKLFFKTVEILRLISGLCAFVFIFMDNYKLELKISVAIFVFITFAGIILNLSIKKYKTIGVICIQENGIVINDSIKILLSDITDLKIHYAGFEGEQFGYMAALVVKDGAENYISFNHEGENYKILFHLKNKGFALSLDSVLNNWKSNKINFNLENYYKRKINSIKDAKR